MAIPRSQWGARSPKAITNQIPNGEVYLHHSVDGVGQLRWTRAEERTHLKQIQNFHMDTRGWSDIAYSFILFPSGRLYEGRGSFHVPAAQEGHNTGTIAICNVGNYDVQRMTRRQRRRLVLALKRLRKQGWARFLHGHRDAPGASTACPGIHIEEAIPGIARSAGLR